jgi:Flp pilus assembly protein TadB
VELTDRSAFDPRDGPRLHADWHNIGRWRVYQYIDVEQEGKMAILLVIGIILMVLWVLGLLTSYTLGGAVYIALVIGLILVVIWMVQYFRGRRT